MIDLGPHAAFIAASYALTAVVIGGLIVWALADYRSQQRTLAELEQRGAGRSSPTPSSGA